MKQGRGTCGTFFMHVPSYLLALYDFRSLFNSPFWYDMQNCKEILVKQYLVEDFFHNLGVSFLIVIHLMVKYFKI